MRTILTEDESKLFVDVGDQFCQDLAKITAKALAQSPEAIKEELTERLQNKTSLYSPYTFDLTHTEVWKLRHEK